MKEIIQQLPAKAREKNKEHRKFFSRLKKKPPKQLDYLMETLHEDEFGRTDCLQCANCCKTTGPLFTEKDIQRISKFLKMKPQQFIASYLRVDEEEDHVLQQLPCTFLDADNRCMIYEVRPKACREFPHTNRKKFQQISNLTLKNVAICPAAFNIVEELRRRVEGK
ncbi:YkgJ family cysteine cluster protein [Poritiphilus flavus]|uniref:YkgJ family cysteine cluster protein n=1 Tax=Poritiphilus flavus TaxID=2697053 RepID=A0A6L9EHM5_9FLAO|nr:YkgJ family cysteine cluster protein [Poritiphilus flavus]NAS14274.1 YkgJ family cysteine cluster protein [Poritiphilus flavus]